MNTAPGHKVAYGNNEFSKETETALQLAPHLNGGLFQEKELDTSGYFLPDSAITKFYEYLFSYHFTIEENTLYDEELELNPEFLGIIFERLVNKENGAVYTPRMEVDLMCRLSLVEWLSKNAPKSVDKDELYRLFFREGGSGEEYDAEQKRGEFSTEDTRTILDLLENVAICDPAVGSGAFPVGMLQVLDEVEESLRSRLGEDHQVSSFERKRRIIGRSLYGVEVKEWAVWIAQLRLWITLFIEATDDMRRQSDPILPSLDFKIRQGDSLIQLLGNKLVPAGGELHFGRNVKMRLSKLKQLKEDFYYNKLQASHTNYKEIEANTFIAVFDEQLESLSKERKQLLTESSSLQEGLFRENVPEDPRQQTLFREHLEEISEQIQDIEEAKRNVKTSHPLIWSIEFAEIFGEKGGFDIVIGNPPYVRQEKIADPLGRIDAPQYKDYLEEMVRTDFPDYFAKKAKIDRKSDLFAYFYIRGLRLVNERGLMTYICSNSWLDVGYGVWMQKFMLEHAPVRMIIDNHAERSFAAADVNTIISVIDAPAKSVSKDHIVKFVAFKEPFEKVIFTENLLAIEHAKNIFVSDVLRVYPETNHTLYESGMEYEDEEKKKIGAGDFIGEKWGGKYLRAPDIFFTILEKGRGKLVPLKSVADVRRGITTGVNDFFYLDAAKQAQWNIEPEYLRSVIKSPRECKSILVDLTKLKFRLFYCNKSKAELKGTNALKYIEWGETQKTEDGVLWHNVPSVRGRKFWWGVGVRTAPKHIFPAGINDVYRVYLNNEEVFADKRLYEAYPTKHSDLSAIFNSTLYMLMQEQNSRVGLGEGLLDLTVYEVQSTLVIDPSLIDHTKLIDKHRVIKDIFEEVGINPRAETLIEEQNSSPQPDRALLDKEIFNALGLTEEERKDVYRAVCRLVWNRISKAKS